MASFRFIRLETGRTSSIGKLNACAKQLGVGGRVDLELEVKGIETIKKEAEESRTTYVCDSF